MAIHGKMLLIYYNGSVIGGTTISAERSCNINMSCDEIETSNLTPDWKSAIAGRKRWSVSVGWLVPAVSNISEMLKVGTTYTLLVKSGSTTILSGQALCQQSEINATIGNLVRGTFRFSGTGALQTG